MSFPLLSVLPMCWLSLGRRYIAVLLIVVVCAASTPFSLQVVQLVSGSTPQLINFQVWSDVNCTVPVSGYGITNLSTPSDYNGCSNSTVQSFNGLPVWSSQITCQQTDDRLYLQVVMYESAGDVTCKNLSNSVFIIAYGESGCVPGWYLAPYQTVETTIYATLSCNVPATPIPNSAHSISAGSVPFASAVPLVLGALLFLFSPAMRTGKDRRASELWDVSHVVVLLMLFSGCCVAVCRGESSGQGTAASTAGLFELVSDSVGDGRVRGLYNSRLISLRESLTVTLFGSSQTMVLPTSTLMLIGGIRGSGETDQEEAESSWISTVSGGRPVGADWIQIQGGNGIVGELMGNTVTCSSRQPLTIVSYLQADPTNPYLSLTRTVSNWTVALLNIPTTAPSIGLNDGGNCVIDSKQNVYIFFGLKPWSTPVRGNNEVWRGHVDVSAQGNLTVDWQLQSGNNSLTPLYSTLNDIHRRNTHLNGTDVLYAVDGFTLAEVTNSTYQDLPLRHVSASIDGQTWHLLPAAGLNRTSTSPLSEALIISDLGVIALFDTSVAELYASLDGGLSFGRCGQRTPFINRYKPAATFDANGYLWLIGGYIQADVWKSSFSFNDVKQVASQCGLTSRDEDEIGLTEWPPSSTTGELPTSGHGRRGRSTTSE